MGELRKITMKVAVASSNPVKIEATRKAFATVFHESVEIISHPVQIDLPAQPYNEDTIESARKRAVEVLHASGADIGVGLEGGIDDRSEGFFATAWCAIADHEGSVTYGQSFSVPLPDIVVEKMRDEEKEMGDVMDELLNSKNTKQQNGFFGFATNDHVTREHAYVDMILAALAPRVHRELYTGDVY